MSASVGPIVSFVEALEIVRTHALALSQPDQEFVELPGSLGRVLAEEIRADRNQPPFNRSTRDGFGVRAAEWNSGERLRVAGQVRAGEVWRGGEIPFGSAVEIMTGAPVPPGMDAVAMVEHAEASDRLLRAGPGRSLVPGENIVPAGSEAQAGEVLLPAGTRMGAAEIAVAATCGRVEVAVWKRPQIAVAATGDELVELAETPGPQQIRNSNSYALASLVELAGGRPGRLEIARDIRSDVRERILRGRRCDLLILSGGVSVGKYDLVEEVLAEFGAEFFFRGVQMQPGKPVVFGRLPARQDQPFGTPEPERYFFGLPGNPVSTQVTFHCFVEPLMRVLGGEAWTGPNFAQGILAGDLPARQGLTRVLPARRKAGLNQTMVSLVGWQSSGDLAANSRANCYAVIPDGASPRAGDVITILLR